MGEADLQPGPSRPIPGGVIRNRFLPAVLVAAGCLTSVSSASAQATRTWVSGVGDDANPCTRTAPCKTFAGTISKTAAGGEINLTDPGAFGTVTITKAITIDALGVAAGVTNTGVNGVVINAGANDNVVLRGLSIFGGSGADACGFSGSNGIRVLNAGNVRVEDVKIGRQNKGVEIAPTTGPVNVLLNRVDLTDNCTGGVAVAPTGTGSAKVTARASTISNSGTAFSVADGGAAWLTGNLFFANTLALSAAGTGEISDFGDNRYAGNTDDGKPTKDLAPIGTTGPAGPTGATGATGATGPAGPVGPAGDSAVKLLLARPAYAQSTRAGRPLQVRYGATDAATTVFTLSRSGKAVRKLVGTTRAGTNRFQLVTKGLSAGRYVLAVRATGADGQVGETKITVRLRNG